MWLMSRHGTMLADSRGFSMIEILVALLIIAVGVLGAAALQSRAGQAGMETYQRTQALLLVEDMVSRMKNNKSHVSACYAAVGRGTPGYLGTGVTRGNSSCNAQADRDLEQWHNLLRGSSELSDNTTSAEQLGGILNARGCITELAASGEYRGSVAWQGLSSLVAQDGKDACGRGAFESGETYRRVVGVTLRITDLR